MRLIDADSLKKAIIDLDLDNESHWSVIFKIDNAPTIERILCRSRDWSNECTHSSSFEQGYVQGYEDGKNERPKGKWEYTTHHARRYRVCPICTAEKEDDHAAGWNFCQHCGARME